MVTPHQKLPSKEGQAYPEIAKQRYVYFALFLEDGLRILYTSSLEFQNSIETSK